MKIFSLESKAGLVVWSVILGIVIERIIFPLSEIPYPADGPAFYVTRGFPFIYYMSLAEFNPYDYSKLVLNLLVWIVVVLIILSLVRYFRKKKAVLS